ncbi:MAG: magnesium transporter MgtC [Bacteroidales bacterium]|nr:magnesium transporter MgtC [Bacteroidales bacterium]MBR6311123.1 MgtC/SapB family protein [Paludibacteraceae bacterium]MDD6357662.1 MgtC/SapB family protein [Bacteroidales bacterium]
MEKEFVVRILVATLLGALIGLDREYRTKAAGFRTHCMVALGSALFMIVSAYGFKDVMAAGPLENIRLDVSRIAAQVVTGIGFIGAGAIIIQKKMVRGLTTAAGLWVTSAIGLACGAGMYLLATVTALLVLLCYEGFNMFLHKIRGKGDEEEMHKDEE